MKTSIHLWRWIGYVALVTTGLLLTGFGYAVYTVVNPQASNISDRSVAASAEENRSDQEVHIVALGDSLTKGTGDSRGLGYVDRLRNKLANRMDKPVYRVNFAVNGYETTELLNDLRSRQGITAALKQADVIVLTIGGNDLFQAGDVPDPGTIRDRMPEAIRRLGLIMDELYNHAPEAAIYYLGLYNPFADLDSSGQTSLLVREWNNEVFKLTQSFDNIYLVPVFDLFARNGERLLSSDHYHPNGEGYERIADRLVQLWGGT